MSAEIRKIVTHIDETLIEGGKAAGTPWRMVAVAAVVKNPWAGKGFVDDLKPEILAHAPILGEILVPRVLDACGGGDKVLAYGKSAVVGLNGEIEHGSGLIHTLRFGNWYRDAVGGTSYLSFTNTRSGPGQSIQIPMMHKHDPGFRDFYITLEFSIQDAPGPDEIVVALGGATSGRPHHRIGNRYSDMEEMGIKQDG
jgi:hypothetical protein